MKIDTRFITVAHNEKCNCVPIADYKLTVENQNVTDTSKNVWRTIADYKLKSVTSTLKAIKRQDVWELKTVIIN